jgi:hypothetical protein
MGGKVGEKLLLVHQGLNGWEVGTAGEVVYFANNDFTKRVGY